MIVPLIEATMDSDKDDVEDDPYDEEGYAKTLADITESAPDMVFVLERAPDVQPPQQWKTTLGGLVGNVLEWYDFAVYGALAENIGAAFFPDQCDNAASLNHTDMFNTTSTIASSVVTGESGCAEGNLIESFAVFGGAFLMRPIGALIFGHIGDKYGRKRALELSVWLMCVSTVAMGCLPTFEQAGVVAPLLLCVVRLVQGVSVGGELIGSIVYTTETAPVDRWGLYGCLALMTAVFGTAVGMAVGALMHAVLDDDALNNWGWRIPFLFGLFLGFFAIWWRTTLTDSQEYLELLAEGKISKNPLKEAVTTHLKATTLVFLVALVWANYFYICWTWMRVYLVSLLTLKLDHTMDNAHGIILGGLVALCIFFPPFGLLSDIIGSRRKVMIIAGSALTCLTIPLFLLIVSTDNAGTTFAVIFVFAVLVSAWGAPMCTWMVEAFPVQARYSAVAIGYNLAQSLTGASPLLCTYLVMDTVVLAPAYFLTIIAFVGTIAIYFSSRILKTTYGSSKQHTRSITEGIEPLSNTKVEKVEKVTGDHQHPGAMFNSEA
eukprot:m.12661 g.12661  ORF g.12661 m.12661 type:complete len:548 (+) comp9395_c0_seq1:511-2154(+)